MKTNQWAGICSAFLAVASQQAAAMATPPAPPPPPKYEYRQALSNFKVVGSPAPAPAPAPTPIFTTYELSTTAIDFNEVPVGSASEERSFLITNTGSIPLTDLNFGYNVSDYEVSTNCPTTLAAGASCAVSAIFRPTVAGPAPLTIHVSSSNGLVETKNVELTAVGTQATMSFSGSGAFDTLNVGQSASRTITFTNAGSNTASNVSLEKSGDSAFSVTSSSCGTVSLPITLAPNASCSVSVTFAPLVAGSFSGQLTLNSNASNSALSVGLSGTAQAETDPLFANVTHLFSMDGVNGGTSFPNAKGGSASVVGTVTTSTEQVKFGTASAKFVRAGALLTPSQSTMTGNWTIEMWTYPTSSSVQMTFVNFYTSGQAGINFWRNPSHQIVIDNGVNATPAFTGATVPTNAWTHIAAVRNGTTTTIYVNGTAIGSNSFNPISSTNMAIGRLNNITSVDFGGFIDDFRVTQAARYTGNFTPPVRALPAQ